MPNRWFRFAEVFFIVTSFAACVATPTTEPKNLGTCSASTCTGCCNGNTCVGDPSATACGTNGSACTSCNQGETCTQGQCGPANCNGCVDQNHTCQPGTSTSQCGIGGSACTACAPSTTCQSGRCGTASCAGCKDPTQTCQSGSLNTACGKGGAACVACSNGQVCSDRACTAPPTCDATNCPGCCDDNDMCQTGDTVTACGSGGAGCSACSGNGATCDGDSCHVPCGPDNCAGCCDDTGTCVASTDSACGNSGVACVPCDPGDICSSGACIGSTCKGSCPGCCAGAMCKLGSSNTQCGIGGNTCGACVSGQVCTNNVCQVDPNSLWDLVFVSGTAPAYDKNNDAWDPGGFPDPLMQVVIDLNAADSQTGGTGEVDNALMPNWTNTSTKGVAISGAKASFLVKASTLQMQDSDLFVNDDMGTCGFKITQNLFGGALWMVTCGPPYNSVGVTWTVLFKIVPHTN